MNTLQEKIEILKAMDKGLTIQYSETDGETDDWEDLLKGWANETYSPMFEMGFRVSRKD